MFDPRTIPDGTPAAEIGFNSPVDAVHVPEKKTRTLNQERERLGLKPYDFPEANAIHVPVQQPSVVRMVHYVGPEGCQAAIVTAVHPDLIQATVFPPRGGTYGVTCAQDESEHAACTWHWPERV
jgi:hypothetical protein